MARGPDLAYNLLCKCNLMGTQPGLFAYVLSTTALLYDSEVVAPDAV